jgi:hypothetical protein
MTQLNQDQIFFLEEQGIPISWIFDATGMSPKEFKKVMEELGMSYAIGVSPCFFGHTLKNKRNRCVQCETRHIAFSSRYHKSGFIYVARSEDLGLIKIGIAEDMKQRQYSLNNTEYGGCSDWEIQFTLQCNKMGRLERDVLKALKTYNIPKPYWRLGSLVHCNELFNCEVELAIKTIKDTILLNG